MKNQVFKDYTNDVYNKEKNYETILSKFEEVEKMKIVNQKRKLNKVAMFIGIVIVGVISSQVYAKISWNIEFNEYQNRQFETGTGIIKDDYTQEVSMDYIEQSGIKAKVDSLVITDDHFGATIDFEFDENIEINSQTFRYGVAVYDDNKNVYGIYSRIHSNEKYDKYPKYIYEDIGVKYNKKDIYAVQLQNACGFNNIEATGRQIKTEFTMESTKGFPRSNKVYIRVFDLGFDMYDFSDKENIIGEEFTVSDKEWIFEIDVPQKFYERLTTNLELKENIEGVNLTKLTVTETGMVITGIIDGVNDIISQGKDMSSSQWVEMQNNLLYITDGNGNRYNNIGFGTYTEGKDSVHIKFDVTKKVFEDSGLYLNYTDKNGKLYTVELVKSI